jgi:hypothetical protein
LILIPIRRILLLICLIQVALLVNTSLNLIMFLIQNQFRKMFMISQLDQLLILYWRDLTVLFLHMDKHHQENHIRWLAQIWMMSFIKVLFLGWFELSLIELRHLVKIWNLLSVFPCVKFIMKKLKIYWIQSKIIWKSMRKKEKEYIFKVFKKLSVVMILKFINSWK